MKTRRWQRDLAFVVLGLALIPASGCMDPKPASPTVARPVEPAPEPAAGAINKPDGRREYTLRGVVRAVDVTEGEVTIDHEALPGFMEAMVMPFIVRNRSVLENVRVGDVVYGPIVVDFRGGSVKNYELTELTVTATAPAEPNPAPMARPTLLKVGDLVPDFEVTMQDGKVLHLTNLRGKVVALTFIYTRCPLPDFCPAVDNKFAEINRRVTAVPARAERVALLSVSFDPQHDTPEVLQAHARRRGAKPPWIFAVASAAELAQVGPRLGLDYYPERDQFAHNLSTALIRADGTLDRLEIGRNWTAADLAAAMIRLIPPPAKP